MSWVAVEIEQVHKDAIPAHSVVGVLSGTIPFHHFQGEATINKGRPFDALEEFVVRSLVELKPCPDDKELTEMLGIGNSRFVAPITKRLEDMGVLVRKKKTRSTTKALRDAHKECQFPVTNKEKFACLWEPLGKRVLSLESVQSAAPTEDETVDCAAPKKPAKSLVMSWLADDEGPLSGLDIVGCGPLEFVETTLQTVQIVVYADLEGGEVYWEPFEPSQERIAVELRSAVQARGAETAIEEVLNSLPEEAEEAPTLIEPNTPEEAVFAPYHKELQGLEERNQELVQQLVEAQERSKGLNGEVVKAPSNAPLEVKRYDTSDAIQRMDELIRGARKQVLMNFPWIKFGAITGPLLDCLQSAVDRGVHVVIAYGIAQAECDEESHRDAIGRLEQIVDKKKLNRVHVVWVGNGHSKELLVDGEHLMSGSLNYLSYRPQPGRKVRREVMTYSHGGSICTEVEQVLTKLCQAGLFEAARRGDKSKSPKAWRQRWAPIAALKRVETWIDKALGDMPERNMLATTECALDVFIQYGSLEASATALGLLLARLSESDLSEHSPALDKPKRMIAKSICRKLLRLKEQQIGENKRLVEEVVTGLKERSKGGANGRQ